MERKEASIKDRVARAGIAAVVASIVGILVGPFHALAYFATPDGVPGAIPWAEAGRDLLGPALDWSDADTVYRSWGKVFVVATLGFVAGLYGVRVLRRDRARGVEKAGAVVATIGYSLLVLGALGEYWGPEDWLDPSFQFLSLPGLLLGLVGSTLFGIGLVRAPVRPILGAWLLALSFPLVALFTALWGHLPMGLLPLEIAWITIGWALWKGRLNPA